MTLGHSGIEVPALCFGAWGIGGGTSWGEVDDSESLRLIDTALENGMNFIDTAPVYGTGHSEEVVARAIKGRRAQFVIETKCGLSWRENAGTHEYDRDGKSVCRNLSAASIRADLEGSLLRLGTDYVDIYTTHRQSDTVSVAETMGALLELKKEGKIRAIGISNATPEKLAEYLAIGQVDVAQEHFSILLQKKMQPYLAAAAAAGTTFQAFSVLERGMLTGTVTMELQLRPGDSRGGISWYKPENRQKVIAMLEGWKPLCEKYHCSIPNLVLGWTLAANPGVNVICGVRHTENLLDNLRGAALQLDEADLAQMSADALALQ